MTGDRRGDTQEDATAEDAPDGAGGHASHGSSRSTWGLIVGASLVSTGLAAYEIAPASVTPVIRTSLGIGPAAAGLIVGVMFGAAVVSSIPVGVALDRRDSRRALGLAVLALLVAGAWGWQAGRAGDFVAVLASRVLGGVAFVVVWNAGIDLVSRGVDPAYRATAVGIFTASGPLGFAIGLGTGPLVTDAFGWPAIFIAFTGVTVLGLAVFWPASRGVAARQADPPTLREFGAVLRNRHVWQVCTLGFLGYALYLFVNSWGATYLTDKVGLSLAASGLLVAAFPAVGVVSRVASGVVSDRLFGGRRRPVVLASFGLAAPLVLVVPHARPVALLVPVLLLAGFAVQLTLGLSFTYVREVVDPTLAASAVAVLTSLGLAGAFLAPSAGGALIDAAGFRAAFAVAAGMAGLGVVLALRLPEPAAR